MTKEELEKEAEEIYTKTDKEFMYCQDEGEIFTLGYLAGAEPREKRIAELEKENAELKEQLKTSYRKGMRHMAKALKDYDRTDGAWTDYFEHTVDKVLQRELVDFEEYGTLADQLTKVKDLLKQWLQTSKASGCDNINIVTDTEQFISEVEK